MAFVPRVLKVSQPPVKKARRPVLTPHVTEKETVACHEASADSRPPHSASTSVGPVHSPTIVYGPTTSEPTQGISDSERASPTTHLGSPVGNDKNTALDDDSEDEPVVSYCKDQRWPLPGEPVCVVCGRYGAYISDATEDDVCSLECKARAMHLKGLPLPAAVQLQQQQGGGERSEGAGPPASSTYPPVGCNYREHPDVASLSEEQVEALRTEVMYTGDNYMRCVCT